MMYTGRNPGIYDSCEICKEQVDGYKNSCYKGYKTKKEAEGHYANYVYKVAKDHYVNYVCKEKINHEVCKIVWTSGRVKNLIIFIQLIVIMVLLLSRGLVCMCCCTNDVT